MKIRSSVLVAALWLSALGAHEVALAQDAPQAATVEAGNRIEKVEASEQAGSVSVRFTLAKPLAAVPASFTVANPARIAFDLPRTSNGLGRSTQVLNQGGLRSTNIVQVGDRTRVVLNLDRMRPYEARIEDNALIVRLPSAASRDKVEPAPSGSFASESAALADHSIRDIAFRRGKDGEARLIVDLSDPNGGIDIRQQGGSLILEFVRTSVPENLRRRLDVTDFGTPVDTVLTQPQGQNVRMVVTPHGKWEHNAYQSDSQFVLEVRPVHDDGRAQAKGRFQGEKLSLNFQNIDVRSVLQVIADFTNLNIVASDTVQGNLTLRLKDVPWDQALDIILQARGLDMRRNGSVIWIAPREELAAKEKLELESVAQIDELEPVHTESFQINYHKARSIADFLKTKEQSVLTKRGSVTVDERSNKLFVSDISSRLEDVRKLVTQIDVPVRQVLIEARIVDASDTFTRNIGAKLGFGGAVNNRTVDVGGVTRPQYTFGSGLGYTSATSGVVSGTASLSDTLAVNLPASQIVNRTPGALSMVLWNNAATRFLELELSALEADGRGKVVSRPRVMTADQVEALIEQGVEIPYQTAASAANAPSVQFKKANLALKVRPQITPDGRVSLSLEVNKDTPNATYSTANGIAIDTKHVKTEVLIENGGTVVIGGIFEQTTRNAENKIPFLGDVPVLGYLFKSQERVDNRTELLVFITPRIVDERLQLQ